MTSGATGRYAPSPSGDLHLGNLRTALLAHAASRAAGAPFLLRIDDLDAGRSRAEYEARQLADLRAIGVDWDGEPLRQSAADRRGAHDDAIAALDARELLYPCWCTRAEIREAASAAHGPLPEGAYPGTCRRLTDRERTERERSGRPPALRLDAGGTSSSIADRVHGSVTAVVDDLVVRRNDGAPAYHLATVVDDAAQGIGLVVRGDDLLESAPRQAHLARLLGLPVLEYAHVPLVLGPDGRRLAKRDGAVTLADRVALGESPDGVRAALLATIPGSVEPGAFSDAALGGQAVAWADLERALPAAASG